MYLDNNFMHELLEKAAVSERRRMNYDLRNGNGDGSQRMLNGLMPDTVLPIHRHRDTSETVAVMRGSLCEVFYDEQGVETARFELKAGDVLQIPQNVFHTIFVHEPTIILEAKDGAYRPLVESEVL